MAFYLALLAVGAHPKPIVVLIAFGAANVAGMIPPCRWAPLASPCQELSV